MIPRSAEAPADTANRIRRLLDFVEPKDRQWCVASMSRDLLQDRDALSQVTGVDRRAIDLDRRKQDIGFGWVIEKAIRGFMAIAADPHSAAVLTEHYRALSALAARNALSEFPTEGYEEVSLAVAGRTVRLRFPLSAESLLLLSDIFLTESYKVAPTEGVIYDFGANIGVAAIYLGALHPKAKLVCVEPMPENLALLEENLRSNHLAADVLPNVVGDRSGTVTFFRHPVHSLGSLYNPDPNAGTELHVEMLPLDRVVTARSYGIKIDIQGAEHALAAYPDVWARTQWVVGEIHYGDFLDKTAAPHFEQQLLRHFEALRTTRPVFFGGFITKNFATLRKLDAER